MNRSFSDKRLRVRIPFGVSYSADVFVVKEVALQVAEEMKKKFTEILDNPSPSVSFIDYGNSSLDFVLLIWIEDPYKEMLIKSETRFILFKAFKEHNIEIPFPQRDLHLRSIDKNLYSDFIKSNKNDSQS